MFRNANKVEKSLPKTYTQVTGFGNFIFFSLHAGSFLLCFLLLSSADIFLSKLTFSKKKLSGTLAERQTDWIQIRTDFQSVLIWVKRVCKGYQQTTKVAATSTCRK